MSLLGVIGTPHTVSWESYEGDTGDGAAYADAVDVEARVEPSSKQVQLDTGRVVMLASLVVLPGTVPVKTGDRLTIDGKTREVVTVDTPVWLDGTPMHHEVGVTQSRWG